MKYKLLLTGNNQSLIEDFFYMMGQDFECQSTSIRFPDVVSHMKYFEPDALVYCITEESKDNFKKFVEALCQLERNSVKLILIGDRESCNVFENLAVGMVKLTLVKPITATAIQEKVLQFLAEEQRIIQAEKEKKEQQLLEKRMKEAEEQKAQAEKRMEEKIRQIYEEKKQRSQQEQQEKERQQRERQQQEQQERKAIPASADGSKHILVIDDDPRMLRLIKEELREEYNVATAVSGKIAMKFLERKQTNLILLDYEMPEEDGPAVLAKLRENPQTKNVPVIFLTGINESEKIQKVLAMKPQGYLLKPIESSKLFQTIRKVIG